MSTYEKLYRRAICTASCACVHVFVCVRAHERERACVCALVRVHEC